MLEALKVSEDYVNDWPPFCAHIDFEFLSSSNGQKYVHILYLEKPLLIDNAKSPVMTLVEFLEKTKWVRMNEADWLKACSAEPPHNINIPTKLLTEKEHKSEPIPLN